MWLQGPETYLIYINTYNVQNYRILFLFPLRMHWIEKMLFANAPTINPGLLARKKANIRLSVHS